MYEQTPTLSNVSGLMRMTPLQRNFRADDIYDFKLKLLEILETFRMLLVKGNILNRVDAVFLIYKRFQNIIAPLSSMDDQNFQMYMTLAVQDVYKLQR